MTDTIQDRLRGMVPTGRPFTVSERFEADQTAKEAASHIDTQDATIKALVEALGDAKASLDGEPEYHEQGMGCGLEDRNIMDRYDAMAFGWDQALERMFSEHINDAKESIDAALAAAKETT